MNWVCIEDNWKQLKGRAKEQWGKLAEDQFESPTSGANMVGAIQKTYGITRDQAERQAKEWGERCERMFDKVDKAARRGASGENQSLTPS